MPNFNGNTSARRQQSLTYLCGMISALTVFLAWPLTPAQAGGGLMVSPNRLEFEGKTRKATFYVVNKSTETSTYRLSLINCRMNDDGRIAPVDRLAAGEASAEDFIHFSPREFVLPPGKTQTLRLQLRKPANLATGEYRSHLKIQEIASAESGHSLEGSEQKRDTKISIKLGYLFSMVLPLIVRQGNTSASLKIAGANFVPGTKDGGPRLTFNVQREGNRSLYGKLRTSFIPQQGPEQTLTEMQGVAVYCPNKVRRFDQSLELTKLPPLRNGRLRISFSDEGAKAADTVEIPLP